MRVLALQIIDFVAPCPPDGRCVWAGVVRQLVVEVTEDGETRSLRLNERARRVLGEHAFEVLHIEGDAAMVSLRPLAETVPGLAPGVLPDAQPGQTSSPGEESASTASAHAE